MKILEVLGRPLTIPYIPFCGKKYPDSFEPGYRTYAKEITSGTLQQQQSGQQTVNYGDAEDTDKYTFLTYS